MSTKPNPNTNDSTDTELPEPMFRTDSMEDVADILRRASTYARHTYRGEVVAAELAEAAEFVEREHLD